MENLEKVRNCVAHYRAPSEEELTFYRKSRDQINKKIKEFIDDLSLSYIDI